MPLVFDDAAIMTPVLENQLFPLVSTLAPSARSTHHRGRVVESHDGLGAGGRWLAEHHLAGHDELRDRNWTRTFCHATGRSRSAWTSWKTRPSTLPAPVLKQYGLKLGEQLDYAIANGDGATQPLGVFTATNTTGISSVCVSCPVYRGRLGSLESRDSVASSRCATVDWLAWLSTSTTYWRVRAIPQGERDARRLFGVDRRPYMVMNKPWRVQNSIPDGYLAVPTWRITACGVRGGFTVRVETAAKTLSLKRTTPSCSCSLRRPSDLGLVFTTMLNGATADLG